MAGEGFEADTLRHLCDNPMNGAAAKRV